MQNELTNLQYLQIIEYTLKHYKNEKIIDIDEVEKIIKNIPKERIIECILPEGENKPDMEQIALLVKANCATITVDTEFIEILIKKVKSQCTVEEINLLIKNKTLRDIQSNKKNNNAQEVLNLLVQVIEKIDIDVLKNFVKDPAAIEDKTERITTNINIGTEKNILNIVNKLTLDVELITQLPTKLKDVAITEWTLFDSKETNMFSFIKNLITKNRENINNKTIIKNEYEVVKHCIIIPIIQFMRNTNEKEWGDIQNLLSKDQVEYEKINNDLTEDFQNNRISQKFYNIISQALNQHKVIFTIKKGWEEFNNLTSSISDIEAMFKSITKDIESLKVKVTKKVHENNSSKTYTGKRMRPEYKAIICKRQKIYEVEDVINQGQNKDTLIA